MRNTRMLAILVLALGLMVWAAVPSQAGAVGTAFTYQGRLIDANSAADGLYDLKFKLYDDPSVVLGNQVGSDVNKPDVDVIDGYFTVELDFGSGVFDGDARWLEIGVRPGDMNDPNLYTALSPRQEVTPTPYALYAKTAGRDDDWMVSGNDMYSIPSGNVGIGTTEAHQRLTIGSPENLTQINDDVAVFDERQVYITTRDTYNNVEACFGSDSDNGTGIYATTNHPITFGTDNIQRMRISSVGGFSFGNAYFSTDPGANNMIIQGNVGVGTTSPAYDLDVNGDIRAIGSVYYGGTEGNADGTAYTKPDYVFEEGYDLMSIEQVEEYLKKENHLPWMTSAKQEEQENGNMIDMTRMAFETVETAENLQIQVIELNKLTKNQIALINAQQKRISALEARLEALERTIHQDRFAVGKEVQQ